MGVAQLFDGASPETQRLVTDLLEQDAADRAWAGQIGPSLTQADTARLLGKSEQATAKDSRLLRLKTRSGRIAYPIIQFDGRAPLEGIAQVTRVLDPVADPLTVVGWLTGIRSSLGQRRPIDALRDGEIQTVVALARRFAHRVA